MPRCVARLAVLAPRCCLSAPASSEATPHFARAARMASSQRRPLSWPGPKPHGCRMRLHRGAHRAHVARWLPNKEEPTREEYNKPAELAKPSFLFVFLGATRQLGTSITIRCLPLAIPANPHGSAAIISSRRSACHNRPRGHMLPLFPS